MKHVLVVEDDPAVAQMMDQILTLEGYATTLASDGRRAFEALRTNRFDIVVLDVMLPGMDGIEIMKAIREEPLTADVPVVIVSAKTDEATTWAGWKAGCNYYMPKPFDPEELLSILKQHERVPAP